jgi:hypothetical protein
MNSFDPNGKIDYESVYLSSNHFDKFQSHDNFFGSEEEVIIRRQPCITDNFDIVCLNFT